MSTGVGDRIKELRTKANLTQNELAEKLYVSRKLVCMDSSVADEIGVCIPPGMDSGEAVRLVNDFLRTLDDEDCALFVMRYFNFRPTKEISGVLGKRDGTVRNKLVKIRQKLCVFLKEKNENGQTGLI